MPRINARLAADCPGAVQWPGSRAGPPENHQAAVAAVRERPSLLPPPPTAEEILAEGRTTIVAALGDLAEQTTHPARRSLYLELQREVEASTTFADLRKARGTFAFRQADGYWLDRWNALSQNPPESYEEHLRGINYGGGY
ncbi:hypothetical protein ACIRVF_39055 [Kitasatospora sp. NPDC101157]|uniref:hypothetical protein n=1 Tax=Kitasatospora sp. NPDC101157 TaxID=3364098 RepID=UPI00380D81BC